MATTWQQTDGTDALLIEARDLRKSYAGAAGTTPVLDGVTLSLSAGETLALTGESGSGKSTLLHLLAALDTPDSGSIRMGADDVTRLTDQGRARLRRDQIGLVFQQFNLIPSLTVGANIAFQARLAGREDPSWSRLLADRLGLSDLLERYPEQLSGGQQQRVAIGRALAPRPELLLADEPTGNLDETTSEAVCDLMLELAQQTGAGVLTVTHSRHLAARFSRRIHLSRGRLT